jgi:hypothetical protein
MTTPSDPSALTAAACAGQPPVSLPFNSLVQKNASLLSNLNLNSCTTDDITTGPVSLATSSGGFLTGSSGSNYSAGTGTDNSTANCSALNILLQNHDNLVQQLNCIISEDTTNATISITDKNIIQLNITGNLITECPIDQTVSGTIQMISNISPNCAINIQNAVQNQITNFTKDLTNMYKGQPSYSANGQGTKAVNGINSSETQDSVGNQVSDVISTINESVMNENTYTLNVVGNVVFSPALGTCGSLTQEIYVDIMATSIATSAFTSALKGTDLNSLMPPIIPPKSNIGLIIIALVIVLLICGGLAYYFLIYKRGGKVTPKFKYARRFLRF